MRHPLPALLFVAAAFLSHTGMARADVLAGDHVTFDTGRQTGIGVAGDTFTLSDVPFTQDGPGFYFNEWLFELKAAEGYYMTGNFHVAMEVRYTIPEPFESRSLSIAQAYVVLWPPCAPCGPGYSERVDRGSGSAEGTEADGVLHLDFGNTAATGAYDRLYFATLTLGSFRELQGQFQVTSYAVTVETRPLTSTVPELPPAALLGAGFGLLGLLRLHARRPCVVPGAAFQRSLSRSRYTGVTVTWRSCASWVWPPKSGRAWRSR
ncbi:MAG: hypothetical protein ABW069_18185 [Duganella sp.]